MTGPDHVAKARTNWGEDLPDWVLGLAEACNAASQNQVAKRLGVSNTMISGTIANKYSGDLQRLEDLYRGAYEAKTVECPALGTLPIDACRRWRQRAERLQSGNALNVTMFRACRRCPLMKERS